MFPENTTKNAYLVARLKSLKAEFLDDNDIERMIGAPNAEEAFQVLNDTVYARYFGDIKSASRFDIVLDKSLGQVKKMILKLSAPKKTLRFLWLKYDFLNIKSLVKARFAETEPKLNSLGEIEIDNLKAAILESEERELPYGLKHTIQEVIEKYEKEKDSQEVDFILDNKYIELFSRELKKMRSRDLTNFLRREIDLFNLKLYFRFKEKKPKEDAWVSGGFISLNKFKIKDPDKLIEGIYDIHERSLMNNLKEQVKKEGVISLEREGRRILLDILSNMEDDIWGIEPVFAFWQAKVEETKLIHRILTLKNAGIKPEEIHRITGY